MELVRARRCASHQLLPKFRRGLSDEMAPGWLVIGGVACQYVGDSVSRGFLEFGAHKRILEVPWSPVGNDKALEVVVAGECCVVGCSNGTSRYTSWVVLGVVKEAVAVVGARLVGFNVGGVEGCGRVSKDFSDELVRMSAVDQVFSKFTCNFFEVLGLRVLAVESPKITVDCALEYADGVG